jgi:hypothetical protein
MAVIKFRSEEYKAAVAALNDQRNELADFMEAEVQYWGKGNVPESDEYLRLNRAVIDAEEKLRNTR